MTRPNIPGLKTSSQQGWNGLALDNIVDKKLRATLLMNAFEVGEERDADHLNFQSRNRSDPMNPLFWVNSKTQLAPRGGASGWSFSVPAYHQGLNNWLPVENQAQFQADDDYEELNLNAVIHYGIELPKDTLAFVSATSEHGNHQPVALLGGGPLVSHWRGPNPPINSRHLFDIDAQGRIDLVRHAGLHSLTKVQKWSLGTGATVAAGAPDRYSIALTACVAPDGIGGYLRATFGAEDGLFSAHMSGPFVPSFYAKHGLGQTSDGDMMAGALSTNSYFRGSRMPFTAPLRFKEEPYPTVLNGEIPYEVHRHYDANMFHDFVLGQRRGMWREFVKLPIGETPPCEPTKDYSTVDANNNPERSYTPQSVFVAGSKPMIMNTIYFQPRVNVVKGRK